MTKDLKTYRHYLDLFTQSKDLAEVIFWVQQGYIALDGQGKDWDSLDLAQLPKIDFLTEILLETQQALQQIWALPREKMLRSYEAMPPHQLREMDSYCVNWLSRQDGRTKKEKVGQARKIMGVKRKRSKNTGENQLCKAYMLKLDSLLRQQQQQVPAELSYASTSGIQRKLAQQSRGEDWAEVGQWHNLPPNNTLLSHKEYSVIWKGWNKLKHLDQDMEHLFATLEQGVMTVFLGHLLYTLQDLCHCPQGSLGFSRQEGQLASQFVAVDSEGKVLRLQREGNTLRLSCGGKKNTLQVKELSLQIGEKEMPFRPKEVEQSIMAFLSPLDICPCATLKGKTSLPSETQVLVDIFPLSPLYLGEGGQVKPIFPRLLLQEQQGELLPCHHSRGFHLGNWHSILSTIPFDPLPEQGQALRERNRKLIQDLKQGLRAKEFCYLAPDGIDDFLLGDFQGNVRSFYDKVESLPKSLGLAFCHQYSPDFQENQRLLVVDLLGNRLSLTPLQVTKEENLVHKMGDGHPYVAQFQGLVWERHPTITHVVDMSPWETALEKNGAFSSLLSQFSLEGLCSLEENFPFFDEESVYFWHKADLGTATLKLHTYIADFLTQRPEWGKEVAVLTSSPFVAYDKAHYYSNTQVLEACGRFRQIQGELTAVSPDFTLWRDMLPQLEIHVGVQEIPLVRANQKIRPQYGVAVEIPIKDTMVLEGGKEIYGFKVKKEDSLQRYQAVVRREDFGVSAGEIHCKLEMTYEYGAQEPYTLYLVPLQGGRKTKVDWVLQQEEDWQDLAFPSFPQGIDSMELLYGFKTKRRVESLLQTWVPLLEKEEIVTGNYLKNHGYSLTNSRGETIYFSERDIQRMAHRLENPQNKRQKPVKDGMDVALCYEIGRSYRGAVATNVKEVDRRMSDQRFALYRIFFKDDIMAKLPLPYQQAITYNLEALVEQGKPKEGKVGQFHFLILCLCHKYLDHRFYDLCQEKIQTFKPKVPWLLPDSLGIALGNLEREEQKNLLKAVWTLPEEKVIPILAKAMWNQEDFIFACPSEKLLHYFDRAVEVLGELYRKFPKNPKLSSDIALCLEYMLGVFRLREGGEEEICRHLSLNHPKLQTLKSLVVMMGDDPKLRHIYSNIALKRKETRGEGQGENFFHLFHLYLVGDLGGADIQIIQNQNG